MNWFRKELTLIVAYQQSITRSISQTNAMIIFLTSMSPHLQAVWWFHLVVISISMGIKSITVVMLNAANRPKSGAMCGIAMASRAKHHRNQGDEYSSPFVNRDLVVWKSRGFIILWNCANLRAVWCVKFIFLSMGSVVDWYFIWSLF